MAYGSGCLRLCHYGERVCRNGYTPTRKNVVHIRYRKHQSGASSEGNTSDSAGFIVLFADAVIHQLMDWLNGLIRLKNLEEDCVTMADMYKYVSILLLSHTTGFSFSTTISVLTQSGCVAPSLDRIRFIADNVIAFSCSGRGTEGNIQWDTQRDKTTQPEFENLAFRDTRKIFFSPLYLHATLDDDLFGTRASDNQVKMLSSRKADKEGHSADAVADAHFRVLLAIRFRRRQEPQVDSVRKLMATLTEGRGEESLNGCVITADRGYGKGSFMEILMDYGVASIFVMPQHLLRVHPFVAASCLDPFRGDIEEETVDERSHALSNPETTMAVTEAGASPREIPTESQPLKAWEPDRRKEFIINDNPNLGPGVYCASRNLGASGNRVGQKRMTAIAVRERGTDKFAKVLRFTLTIPSGVSTALNTWVAVPKINVQLHRTLFVNESESNGNDQKFKGLCESFIRESCVVLSLSQRCADWFVLRQFRVTGTNASIILMDSTAVRNALAIESSHSVEERTLAQWFELLYRSWFSSKVSTEAMKRGSANEDAVVNTVQNMPFVESVFEVGMLQSKETPYIACSPDGIVVIDVSHFPEWETSRDVYTTASDKRIAIASLEIKTRISPTSLGSVLDLSSADVIRCEVGDAVYKKYIPTEHRAQVLQQLVILQTSFGVYVAAAETGLLYTVVFKCSFDVMQLAKTVLKETAEPLVSWAHESGGVIPTFVEDEKRDVLMSRLKFWKVINSRVSEKGAFVPIKVFKHAAQSLYSKTKGGVDGATQQRAILRCATSHFKWEQKIVSQVLKTVCINAFLAWRMFRRQDLLESSQAFKSLDNYRGLLNKVQTTADFMFQASQELIAHAANLQAASRDDVAQDGNTQIGMDESKRLIAIAHARKRKRVMFFNTEQCVALRLAVRGHTPIQGPVLYCALCGQNAEGWRGHRSSYSCVLCSATLCFRVYPGLRKSCWNVWHSAKQLTLRQLTPSHRAVSTDIAGTVNQQAGERSAERSTSEKDDDTDAYLDTIPNQNRTQPQRVKRARHR